MFDQSFAAVQKTLGPKNAEERDSMDGDVPSKTRFKGNESNDRNIGLSWWGSWKDQMGRLFVPQWRRTVLLMWVIWGCMSFGMSSARIAFPR